MAVLKKMALAAPKCWTSFPRRETGWATCLQLQRNFLQIPAAACKINLPTSVEPVKAILSTSDGPPARPRSFTVARYDVDHPSGNPASMINSANSSALSGSAPRFQHHGAARASAGPSFTRPLTAENPRDDLSTTPIGSRRV